MKTFLISIGLVFLIAFWYFTTDVDMKVKELIKILKKCNPEHDIVLQIDSEGNGYNNMYEFETDLMFTDGEVYRKEDYDDNYGKGFIANCVVLAP